MIMVIKVSFSEIELAVDVKTLISFGSKQACEDVALKEKIMGFSDDCLLNVHKTIASPIKITAVDEVTEEMMANAL